METVINHKLSLLNVLVCKRVSGTSDHKVYRKHTHTDRYLNSGSKLGTIKTLAGGAKRICQPAYLEAELNHFKTALQANGYAKAEINSTVNPMRREIKPDPSIVTHWTLFFNVLDG